MAKTDTKATTGSALSKAFAARLKKSNSAWSGAKEKAKEQKGFAEIEDGRYVARLVNVKVAESNAGRLQSVWAFKIEEGENEGHEKLDFMGLESEQNLEFFARRVAQLGYEMPDDLSEIGDIFEDMNKSKPLCKIRIKTKGEYQNVYLDKVFGEGEEDADDSEGDDDGGAPVKDEDVEETDDAETETEEADEEEADEVEEDETEDDTAELTVGAKVTAETTKGDRDGTVLEIFPDEGKVRVKMDDDGKVLRIAIDKIALNDDVPEEPKAAPKKKTKK
jgi:hypothetical protein